MGERIEASKAIDIEGLVNSINEKMKAALHCERLTKPKIFRAPESVRSSDPDAYEPKLVSIGPYHRAKSKVEKLKWRLLGHYLSRASEEDGESSKDSIDRFLREMKDFEEDSRSYYSEVIDIESDEFVEMLLLDGCFLVQIILASGSYSSECPQELAQLFYDNMWFRNLLFALGIKERVAICTALELFNCFLPDKLKSSPSSKALFQDPEVHHLFHLFHKWIMFDPKGRSGASDPQQEERTPLINETRDGSSGADSLKSLRFIPSVTGLREAGVEVKPTGEDTFLNISFRNGVLSIPAITVDDNTNFILRNLIAFEQCYPCSGMDVTSYTLFMDKIINTPRDAELLCEVEIIDRQIGSDKEIARLFNKMCEGVVTQVEPTYFDQVSKEVKGCCDSKRHRWRARLIHDYFSNPWAAISVVAAAVLLLLTVLQTVYSVLSYQG